MENHYYKNNLYNLLNTKEYDRFYYKRDYIIKLLNQYDKATDEQQKYFYMNYITLTAFKDGIDYIRYILATYPNNNIAPELKDLLNKSNTLLKIVKRTRELQNPSLLPEIKYNENNIMVNMTIHDLIIENDIDKKQFNKSYKPLKTYLQRYKNQTLSNQSDIFKNHYDILCQLLEKHHLLETHTNFINDLEEAKNILLEKNTLKQTYSKIFYTNTETQEFRYRRRNIKQMIKKNCLTIKNLHTFKKSLDIIKKYLEKYPALNTKDDYKNLLVEGNKILKKHIKRKDKDLLDKKHYIKSKNKEILTKEDAKKHKNQYKNISHNQKELQEFKRQCAYVKQYTTKYNNQKKPVFITTQNSMAFKKAFNSITQYLLEHPTINEKDDYVSLLAEGNKILEIIKIIEDKGHLTTKKTEKHVKEISCKKFTNMKILGKTKEFFYITGIKKMIFYEINTPLYIIIIIVLFQIIGLFSYLLVFQL